MNTGMFLTFGLLAVVIVWVIAKVVYYAKKSEKQWEKVDKSRLRQWDDEND